jgi:hypothetical protein
VEQWYLLETLKLDQARVKSDASHKKLRNRRMTYRGEALT